MSSIPNLFLIGPMGAGKTTLGNMLANALNLKFLDTDKEIEKQTGVDIPWIFDVEGETGFRKRETEVLDALTKRDHIVLATGGGVVLKPENREMLVSRGTVIYLKVSIEQQLLRTAKSKNRPLLLVEDVKKRLLSLKKLREPLYESIANLTFDTDTLSPSIITDRIVDIFQGK